MHLFPKLKRKRTGFPEDSYLALVCIQTQPLSALSLTLPIRTCWLMKGKKEEQVTFLYNSVVILLCYTTITITNTNGKSESARKIPLRIFTSAKVCLLAAISTFQFSMAFLIKFDFIRYFKHFPTFYHPSLQSHIIGFFFFFIANPFHGYIFPPSFNLL